MPGKRSRSQITETAVAALNPGELLWDGKITGFGVRRQKDGRIFVLKYRVGGRQRWYTIGKHGSPWTVHKAREKAKALLGDVAEGRDPAAARDTSKGAPTVAELCKRYFAEYAAEHKKASSQAADERNIRNHILPILGRLRVADVTRADIDRLKLAVAQGKTAKDEKVGPRRRIVVRGGTGAANRCLALTSKMFNLAELWGWRPDGSNPCRHIQKYAEHKIERFLKQAELGRLASVLIECERQGAELLSVIAAIRLLIFTGCRRDEILTLRWEDVDLEAACLRLRDSKSGAKVVYLSAPALKVLADLPRVAGNPYVVFGERLGSHLVNLEKPWRRIRAKAKLDDVRLHDLRHSYASFGTAGGLSLPMIGKLLGHARSETTNRYSHLADDPVKAANEAIGRRIAAAMEQKSLWRRPPEQRETPVERQTS
ncbi:site-specific integrase [Rhodospirillaceae bacterium SYSU D60014]|uniref:tyrosine-type recombinase/integrase n=1 Tax=Virgifigura deserti TaxID=2268457 RepID=UPI000E661B4E